MYHRTSRNNDQSLFLYYKKYLIQGDSCRPADRLSMLTVLLRKKIIAVGSYLAGPTPRYRRGFKALRATNIIDRLQEAKDQGN